MSVTAQTLLKTYPELLRHLDGKIETAATIPCSQNEPTKNAIAYVADEKFLKPLIDSPISILVVHEKISAQAKSIAAGKKTLLATKNTYLSMALINAKYFSLSHVGAAFDGKQIHPSAVIDKSAKLSDGVIVGPCAVINANVIIGKNTFVGANTVIEANTTIGENTFLHPQVYISHSCKIGNQVEIKSNSTIGSDGFGYAHDEKGNHYRIPHYGAVIIEDDVHIGANVGIDRGTFDSAIIGYGTKIDNHCHIGHNNKIGKNCLITAGFISAGSATIGDNCVFAGRVSINGHITITSNCQFGPLTAVTNDIKVAGVYAGYPAIEFRQSLKSNASLRHLPKIRKNLARVLKHLGLQDSESEKS